MKPNLHRKISQISPKKPKNPCQQPKNKETLPKHPIIFHKNPLKSSNFQQKHAKKTAKTIQFFDKTTIK